MNLLFLIFQVHALKGLLKYIIFTDVGHTDPGHLYDKSIFDMSI